jgi:sulfide:quinone oxidoreductase
VVTDTGRAVPYDFLVVATGLKLDYARSRAWTSRASARTASARIYASPEAAAATWQAMSAFADRAASALFGRPATEMKCAGAPLKYAFITDDILRRRGNRGKAELIYNAHNKALFSVPIVAEKVRMLYQDRGIKVNYDHQLTAIDLGRRIATFDAGRARRSSATTSSTSSRRCARRRRCATARSAGAGRLGGRRLGEVDRHTLRHPASRGLRRRRRGRRAQGQDRGEREVAGAGRGGPPGRDHRRARQSEAATTATPPAR